MSSYSLHPGLFNEQSQETGVPYVYVYVHIHIYANTLTFMFVSTLKFLYVISTY